MLTVASKICEKVALQQFSNYLQRNGLLNKHNYSGNRKYHPIETLNIMISDFLLDAMDNKRPSALIYRKLLTMLAILYYYRSWALLPPTKPRNGLRVTWLTELRWSILVHLHLHPSLSPMVYHREPYCHHFCFLFMSVIFVSLHKYAISIPT